MITRNFLFFLALLGAMSGIQTLLGLYFIVKKSWSPIDDERRLAVAGRWLTPFGAVMFLLFVFVSTEVLKITN
jgi:hypothetical protein